MPGAGGKLLCVVTCALMVHVKAPSHPDPGSGVYNGGSPAAPLLLLFMSAKPQTGVLRAMEQHKGPMRMDVTFIPVHGVLHSPPTTTPLGRAGIVIMYGMEETVQ